MPYTTNQLISGAYYAAGVVSREFETTSGSQTNDGLMWLNEILAEKRVDDGMVPYESTYYFIAKQGQKVYFIPNLIQIDTIVFYLDSVRYAMQYTKRNEFFSSPRVENIQSLPFEWYFEREVGGGNLYIYFAPDRQYPFEIHGTFDINPVSINQDLTSFETIADLGIPQFYSQGILNSGQLVVNNYDLMGTYDNIGALVNYINSGVIAGVNAFYENNKFVLKSITEVPVTIYIQTNGYPPNGTRTVGTVKTASAINLLANYVNGSFGVGATLTGVIFGALVLEGYTVALDDRVLIKNQTDETQNGIYTVSATGSVSTPWVLTRATGYNQSVNIQNGDLVQITNGFLSGSTYIQNSEVADIGFDNITFNLFNALSFSNFSTIQLAESDVFNANGFDSFYITYLRYALADRICSEYNYVVPDGVAKQLGKYEAWIRKKSRLLDLQMKKVSTLQKKGYINYAFVNLSKGWTPS